VVNPLSDYKEWFRGLRDREKTASKRRRIR